MNRKSKSLEKLIVLFRKKAVKGKDSQVCFFQSQVYLNEHNFEITLISDSFE